MTKFAGRPYCIKSPANEPCNDPPPSLFTSLDRTGDVVSRVDGREPDDVSHI